MMLLIEDGLFELSVEFGLDFLSGNFYLQPITTKTLKTQFFELFYIQKSIYISPRILWFQIKRILKLPSNINTFRSFHSGFLDGLLIFNPKWW